MVHIVWGRQDFGDQSWVLVSSSCSCFPYSLLSCILKRSLSWWLLFLIYCVLTLVEFGIRFKCVDMDCNGVITSNEMRYFYEEQLHRMECMAQEPVLFEDIVCQMCDMIRPKVGCVTLRWLVRNFALPLRVVWVCCRETVTWQWTYEDYMLDHFSPVKFYIFVARTYVTTGGLFGFQAEGYLTLRDLKNCKLSGNFFNILFNLNKFVAFETRDPFLIRQVKLSWYYWIHQIETIMINSST